MSSKRALVVDDSKSARAFLARILERHEIHVDAAESAEAALEYLTRNKPDVIFMDHLMPGMDGFQAVQTIKNNPRTSSIPILMYTSQEGDLYLGQARALGAEGVLPKQIKQTDVTRMLFQLRLVSDRRSRERDQTTFTAMANVPDLMPANESAIIVETPAAETPIIVTPVVEPPVVQPPATPNAPAAVAMPEPVKPDPIAELLPRMSLEIRAAFDASLQKEIAALRTFMSGQLEGHAERLQGDLAALMPGPRIPEVHTAPIIPERRASTWIGWTLALLALAGAAALGWLWWTRGAEVAALKTDLAAAYEELETLRARPVEMPTAAIEAAPEPIAQAVIPAPDASDAPTAAAPGVDLVPAGGTLTPPAQATAPAPATAAPESPAAAAPQPGVPAAEAATAMPDAGTPAAVPPSQEAQ